MALPYCFPFPGAHCSCNPFSVFAEASSSSCLWSMVDDCAKKAALFFLPCGANHGTRLSIPASMRAKVYSEVETVDQILAQQVHGESPKNEVENTCCAETVAAAAAMLALSNRINVVRSLHARSMATGATHHRMRSSNRGEGGRGEQGRERMATTGEDNKNSAFPPAIKWR